LNSIFGTRLGDAIVGAPVALWEYVVAGMLGLCHRPTASSR
jgi:hypothetical protein